MEMEAAATAQARLRATLEALTIPDEYVPYILKALDNYAAFMKATNRDDRFYLEIAESLKKKGLGKEEPEGSIRKRA